MRRVTGLVVVTAVAVVATVVWSRPPTEPDGATDRPDTVIARAAGLQAFDACEPLVEHLRAAATAPGGDLAMGRAMAVDLAMEDSAAGAMAADGAEAAVPAPAGTSGTNVQVAGVDELDLVETDGRRVFTVLDGRLHVADVTADPPAEVADRPLDLPRDQGMDGELLLHEARLLVVLRGWTDRGIGLDMGAPAPAVPDVMPMGTPVTTLLLFDVAADEPVEVARLEVEGELVAGRGIDGTAHLVVAHRPQPIAMPALEAVWSADTQAEARQMMAAALATTRTSDWLPSLAHRDAAGTLTAGPSLDCVDVARPVDTDDTSMLQVLTVDLHAGDVMPEATTAVLTDARSVTATADQLVVATPVWAEPQEPMPGGPAMDMVAPVPGGDMSTRLHLFDLGPEGAVHRASGEVPGALLNQFSMSLHDGHLRVATTAGQPFEGTSESGVTVLRAAGDRLDVVGSVGGLGRGETIHSVRFLGDRAYVVTFRQTDPLYTIDLTDPTAPEVTGELKITGYSAYLHPLRDGRLLGVGQEATVDGQVTGTQVSVFDVADPAAPRRVSQVVLPAATSEAEWDHHAVLVHDGLVVLPYERWVEPTPQRPEGFETAAVVIAREGDRLEVRGTVAGSRDGARVDPWSTAVRRALVVEGRLVTVSRVDVQVHDPVTLATTATIAL